MYRKGDYLFIDREFERASVPYLYKITVAILLNFNFEADPLKLRQVK